MKSKLSILFILLIFQFVNLFAQKNDLLELINKLTTFYQNNSFEKIYLQTDKPFYKPGEDIWFSTFLTCRANMPSDISNVMYVNLINPKGSIEKTLKLVCLNGKGKGDFHLDEAAPGGIYKIEAYTNWLKNWGNDYYFTKEIQVQNVLLPTLLMTLDFEHKGYGAGEKVTAKLKVSTNANKPLSNYKISFTAKLQGKEFLKDSAKTDETGLVYIQFKLPKKLTTGDGLLNVMIDYESSIESISRSIPINLDKVDLQFFPEGGDLVAGLKSKVAFKALNEFGKPSDITGIIIDNNDKVVANFKSYHDGMGAFEFTPEKGKSYSAKILRPNNISTVYDLPEAKKNGFVLSVENVDNFINGTISSAQPSKGFLLAQSSDSILFSEKFKVNSNDYQFKIPANNFPTGIMQLTIFDDNKNPQCERLIFVNRQKQLNINITTDKEKYQPRENVDVTITTTDNTGNPIPATLSLSVVNDKIIAFANDKQDNILSRLLLSSDVRGKINEPSFYFKTDEPKSDSALNYLLMTQGWRRFTPKEIVNADIKNNTFRAEKAIISGNASIPYKENLKMPSKIDILETGQSTNIDAKGYFIFRDVDLTNPVTLCVDFGNNYKIKQIVSQYDDPSAVTTANHSYKKNEQFGGTANHYHKNKLFEDANPGTIVGHVKDKDGVLPGATVSVKGVTGLGTITDFDGAYTLTGVPRSATALVYTFVGMKTLETEIAGCDLIDVVMEQNDVTVSDVVVTAFGIKRSPKEMGVAVDQVNENNVVLRGNANIQPAKFVPPAVVDKVEKTKKITTNLHDLKIEVAKEEVVEESPKEVFFIVEEMPEFQGGDAALRQFVKDNVNYPSSARENCISGKVYVRFCVTASGKIDQVSVARGVEPSLDEEAVRVVKNLPNWKPGMQRGKPVNVWYTIPINFNLDGYKNLLTISTHNYYQNRNEQKFYAAREFYTPLYLETDTSSVRNDFRQTIYWNPLIKTDNNGKTKISFCNSDEITTFRATAEGFSNIGLIGRKEQTYFTQLPFSMAVKIPAYVTFFDTIFMPLTLTNNTSKTLEGKLNIKSPQAFQLINELPQTIEVDANSTKIIYIPYTVSNLAGKSQFTISFKSNAYSDAFSQPVEVLPKGFPAKFSLSDKATKRDFSFDIKDMVAGSMTAGFEAYPDMLEEMMSGIEGLLKEPCGCFEQTSSSTYPNILALRYMNETNQISPAIREKALGLIDRGYKRLTGFETSDNGYEWFGRVSPHEGLTAYGLMEFNDMKNVYPNVDNKMIDRTQNWLLARKDGKGSFSRSTNALHNFGLISNTVHNAYIVYALSEVGNVDLKKEIEVVLTEALESKDAYRLALVANALYNLKDIKRAKNVMSLLYQQIETDGFGKLKAEHSIMYSQGNSLQIETASLIILAMLKDEKANNEILVKGIDFLTKSRTYGYFGSTQGTVLALKALTEYAKLMKHPKEPGTIKLNVNKGQDFKTDYGAETKEKIKVSGFAKSISDGKQNVSINFNKTTTAMPWSFNASWTTYTPNSDENCKVGLKTNCSVTNCNVGETVRMTVSVTNKNNQSLPMTLVKIGIPSALSVQPWQLKELQEKRVFDYYEIFNNYLVLYFVGLQESGTIDIPFDLKAEIPGTYEAPASSAYLYYTNEDKTFAQGLKIVINK